MRKKNIELNYFAAPGMCANAFMVAGIFKDGVLMEYRTKTIFDTTLFHKIAANYYDVDIEKIISGIRLRKYVFIRQIGMCLLMANGFGTTYAGFTYGRDHATATYSKKTIKSLYLTDKRIREQVKYFAVKFNSYENLINLLKFTEAEKNKLGINF